MATSYNGWSASPSPSAIGIRNFLVPGTRRVVPLRSSAGGILVYMAGWWDDNIEDIEQGIMDEWGYSFRLTRGSNSYSCHASGTAMDINATHYPRGTSHMSYAKQLKVRYLVRKVNNAAGMRLVNWGGEWHGYARDQMHIELARGTGADDVKRALDKLTIKPAISVRYVEKSFGAKTIAGRASTPITTQRVQNRLVALKWLEGSYAHGSVGAKTRDAMKGWQKKHGYKPDGVPGKTQLRRIAGTAYRVVD